MDDEKNATSKLKLDLTLHYIDMLYNSLVETERRINRTIVLQVLVSVAMILFFTGTISVDQEIHLIGVAVSISSALLPFVGACLVVALYIHLTSLGWKEHILETRIGDLYEKLGTGDQSLKAKHFELPLVFVDFIDFLSTPKLQPLFFVGILRFLVSIFFVSLFCFSTIPTSFGRISSLVNRNFKSF